MAGLGRISRQPIGMIDSGMGGLSVLADLVTSCQEEEYIYYADSRYAPYGEKDRETVRHRVTEIATFLMLFNTRLLVLACNTATSAAVDELRQYLPIPVIGMEPALKPALAHGNIQRVVVAATPLTLKERKFEELFQKTRGNHEIIPLPCPGLVEIIEEEGPESAAVGHKLTELLAPLKNRRIDRLVLGCTHYVLIRSRWQQAAGPETQLVDGNEGTVRQILRVLPDVSAMTSAETIEKKTHIRLISSSHNTHTCMRMKGILLEQLRLRGLAQDVLERYFQITTEEECL